MKALWCPINGDWIITTRPSELSLRPERSRWIVGGVAGIVLMAVVRVVNFLLLVLWLSVVVYSVVTVIGIVCYHYYFHCC